MEIQNNPGSWDERKGRLKLKFDVLTDEDLALNEENRDKMFENLLTKLGKTREEMHKIIMEL